MAMLLNADGGGKKTTTNTQYLPPLLGLTLNASKGTTSTKPATTVKPIGDALKGLSILGLPGINTNLKSTPAGTTPNLVVKAPTTPVGTAGGLSKSLGGPGAPADADKLINLLGLPDINKNLKTAVTKPDLLITTGERTGGSAGGASKSLGGSGTTVVPGGSSNTTIVTTPAAAGSSGGGGSVSVSNSDIIRPDLWTGKGLADHLGVVYDRAELEKTLSDAAKAKYANLDAEFGRTQDAYYDSVAGNADLLLGTLRRGDRNAAISGASSGSQAATQLSALLGVGQQNAQGATELAQGRGDLVTKRETEIADAKNKSLKDYNDLGLTLGERISSIYNADMVGYSADSASNASTIAAQLAKDASNYAADQGLKGATAAANASITAASKYGGGSTSAGPTAAELKNQEIANLMAALSAPGIDKKTAAAIQAKLNGLMGITVPTNTDVVGKSAGLGSGFATGSYIGGGKTPGGP